MAHQSPIVSCEEVSKTFGSHTLFEGISMGIFDGDRIGLIGLNGSGKSTLIKILAGLESTDHGRRVLRRGTRTGYVPQERRFKEGQTVEDVLQESLDRMSPPLDPVAQSTQINLMLAQTEFPDRYQKATKLSGGWRKRLMIASELVMSPDILFLDEPTNHLDLEGIAWLEDLLSQSNFTYLVISHDRVFLERVTSRIIELSSKYVNGYLSVDGTYSTFLEKRGNYIEMQKSMQDKMENKLRREVEWLRRGPKARTTKSQARIDEAHRLMGQLAEVKTRNQTKTAGIEFAATERETRTLIAVKNVKKKHPGQDRNILDGISFNLVKKMRLGLVGLNGSGKTTLLKLLAGSLIPDSGTIKRAEDLKIVYFTQNRETLDQRQSLRQALSPNGGDTVLYSGREIHVASWAQRFLFRTEMLPMPVSQLSGGEQARILIAQLMLQPADVLLLDEPTNDLDIPTLEILETSLEEFPGAIVLVSHDRFMLSEICNVVLGLDGKGEAHLVADLEQWEREVLRAAKPREPEVPVASSSTSQSKSKRKLSFKEKFELEGIEAKILSAETRLQDIQNAIENPGSDRKPDEFRKLSEELEIAQKEVETLYTRWTELEALAKST